MSRLSNLLRGVEECDPQLAADLRREVEALSERRAFGLNFERHIPETVELPGRPIRRGDKVRFLPERGHSAGSVDGRLWRVARIRRTDDGRIAEMVRKDASDGEVEIVARACDDLVVVAEFRDPIYPGLVSTGKVERGGDKPFHTVINAENFHALQALLYTHEGKVDAIYIDPPYNTGARDWKYNNDYVDSEDAYRHSKWLAMMECRLKLARRLLNADCGVLIVTIDENEVARLSLLLEQTFLGYEISPVHIVHNPRGIQGDNFSFVHETALFVIPRGRKLIAPRTLTQEEIKEGTSPLRNWGGASRREDGANCFYPILVSEGNVVGFGEAVDRDTSLHPAHNEEMEGGVVAVWPVDSKGVERKWRYARQSIEGVRHQLVVSTLSRGGLAGDVEILIAKDEAKQKTVWQAPRYDASIHGTQLVKSLIGRKFPYPKSVYATYDCVRSVVRDRPNAVVLDFFGGSGTTMHAVMAMNRDDGGSRRSIVVTNNEVSEEEGNRLRKEGMRPGDTDWEALGICEYITKPRIEAAVTGTHRDGTTINGNYKFSDEFPIADGFDENVEFLSMTYQAPWPVAHNRAFEAVAPLLWLKAGAQGKRIEQVHDDFGLADTYGVLFDLDASKGFLSAVAEAESVRMAFIVTDDDQGFQTVCGELPARVVAVRLYESYLTNFTINAGAEEAFRAALSTENGES